MVVYILTIASYPPTEQNHMKEVALSTRMEYPEYLEKLYDLGSHYTNYTLYKCEEANLTDAVRFIGKRYNKIASQVQGYIFKIEICLDVIEWESLFGS